MLPNGSAADSVPVDPTMDGALPLLEALSPENQQCLQILAFIQSMPQEQQMATFQNFYQFFVSPAWSAALQQTETTSSNGEEPTCASMSPDLRSSTKMVTHKKPTRTKKHKSPPATVSDDEDEGLRHPSSQQRRYSPPPCEIVSFSSPAYSSSSAAVVDQYRSIKEEEEMLTCSSSSSGAPEQVNMMYHHHHHHQPHHPHHQVPPQHLPHHEMYAHHPHQGYPQMSTPDDPVIHSPPSLGGQLMSGSYAGSIPKMEEGMNCNSPDGSMDANGDADARRRQKTCRVCGDHATGYNFNVITCESCKAFFRRNALRPKEFKCPYSEDCEINAVSRRFCQKCRLRKCFAVGMKKEWILNEEQLRRRKNSRLNNLANQQRQKHQQELARHQAVMKMNSPLSISPMDAQLGALGGPRPVPPLVSPPSQGYPLMSPGGSNSSDSPPSRPMGFMPGQRSPDAYESNMMMQQRLKAEMSNRSPTAPVAVDPARKQVVLSMDAYQNLMQMAVSKGQDEEPPCKRGGYTPTELPTPQPRNFQNPMMSTPTSGFGGMPTYMDIGSDMQKSQQPQFPPGYAEKMERMSIYFDKTIEDALKVDSPDATSHNPSGPSMMDFTAHIPPGAKGNDSRLNYQLNAAELRALDQVNEAFKGMNDQIEPNSRSKQSFLKNDKSPADIMNIMDVAMRRLVKVAKKLPAFNDLSQDGKFALLKAGMVEMLTVRGVARFDPRHGVWRSPTLQEPAEVSFDMFDKLNKDIRGDQKSRVMQFFKIFNDDIRNNELIMSIIILVVLFSPREVITDESDKKIIAKYHDQYSTLLQRYLESLYGDEAQKIYEQVPHALRMLHEISTNSGMLFFGTVNTSEAEPLPREIFKVE